MLVFLMTRKKRLIVYNRFYPFGIKTEIDKSDIEFVSGYFFKLGIDAKIIEPQEVVNNIRQRAHNIISHYK